MLKIKAESKDEKIWFETCWDEQGADSALAAVALLGIKVVCEAADGNREKRKELYKVLEGVFQKIQDKNEEEKLLAMVERDDGEKHTAEG